VYSSLPLNALFVIAVTLIWFMLAYQSVLFFLGHRYFILTRRGARHDALPDAELPDVAILVPCHNEEKVIAGTLRSLLALNYPFEKLRIFAIDDGSTDGTAAVVQSLRERRVELLAVPPSRAARGKAAALNYGLHSVSQPLVAIYDADNRPEPDALRPLVEALVKDSKLGASVGMYRVVNRRRNLLTRFLNIEGIGFQWIVQAGRWMLMRFVTLPGTNYVIRRELLARLGGWDEGALTEDAELTIRIYQVGSFVKFVPNSRSWEQEPETLPVWFRQRHRWVRGHNHLSRKYAGQLLRMRPRRIGLELLYSLFLYYVFFVAVVISDLLFLLSLTGWIAIRVPGPYTMVWVFALAMFVLQLVIALSHEPGEDSALNISLIGVMYFTYCQLWIPLVAKAFWDDFIVRKPMRWAKTERFDVAEEPATAIVPGEPMDPATRR
jgi:cellulose synthase/poly-beta-1,6-N-acetylglucosamine synthase-like glycosyltransferase